MTHNVPANETLVLGCPAYLTTFGLVEEVEVKYTFSTYGIPETHVSPLGSDLVVWRIAGHQDATATVRNWLTKPSMAIYAR